MKILIVEDNQELAMIVQVYLNQAGFSTQIAYDGEDGLNLFYQESFDLAVVDWMLPKINGIDLIKEIKKNSPIKILMLTARDLAEDELISLQAGADDYMTKPFHPGVLVLRIQKLLALETQIILKDKLFIPEKQQLIAGQEVVDLTKREVTILVLLLQNKGQILSREQILNQVWGFDQEVDYRSVDTQIKRLREKVGHQTIKTIRGVGYTIET